MTSRPKSHDGISAEDHHRITEEGANDVGRDGISADEPLHHQAEGHIYATASRPKGRTRAATPRTGSGVLQSNSSLTDMPAVPQSRLSSAVTAMRRCC